MLYFSKSAGNPNSEEIKTLEYFSISWTNFLLFSNENPFLPISCEESKELNLKMTYFSSFAILSISKTSGFGLNQLGCR